MHHSLDPKSLIFFHGNGEKYDLSHGIPHVQTIYQIEDTEEIPVSITQGPENIFYIGTNKAIYELDSSLSQVRAINFCPQYSFNFYLLLF